MADETTPKDLTDTPLPSKTIEASAASPATAEAMKIAPQAVKRSMPMGLSIALGILLAGLIGWLFQELVWFLLVLYLSFVAATIIEAPVGWLKRRGIRRGFSAVIIMVSALALLGGVGYLLTNGVINQISAVRNNLDKAPDRINNFVNGFLHKLPGHSQNTAAPSPSAKNQTATPPTTLASAAVSTPESAGPTSTPAAAPTSAPATAPATAPAFEDFNVTQAIRNALPSFTTVWSNTMWVVEVVSWLVIMYFIVLYMLVDGADHLLALRRILPKSSRLEATRLFHEIAQAHRGWALASLSNVCSASILIGTGLWLIGIPGAFLMGFVAGLGELIPNIGPVLGAMPAILFTLVIEPDKFLYVVGMFVIAQTIQSYTISPMMLKFSIELPVLVTIISVLVFGILFGLLGILVAIPIVADMVVIWQYVNKHLEKDTTDYDIVNVSASAARAPVAPDNSAPARLRKLFRRTRPDTATADSTPRNDSRDGLARLDDAQRRAERASTEQPKSPPR